MNQNTATNAKWIKKYATCANDAITPTPQNDALPHISAHPEPQCRKLDRHVQYNHWPPTNFSASSVLATNLVQHEC